MKITMAHGSGGKATGDLIQNIFQKYLGNKYLDKMADSAFLPASSYPLALTTDSFVITPLEFPGGDIGKLAVCGTVNDLWMAGAEPQFLTAGFILEEGLDLKLLERVVASLGQTAKEAGVQVVAGDTKVIEGQGGLIINTAGVGYRKHSPELLTGELNIGDAVILSGSLGNHQACILSQRLEIENNIVSDCADLGPLVRGLLQAGLKVRLFRDVTRGGLGTILNEIAQEACVGIEIEETALPIDIEVSSFCEILGLDPLYMANEGKFVCLVSPDDEKQALKILRNNPLGKNSALIGRITRTDRALVTMNTRIGGKRIIDVLYGEGLPRIC
ncbi:MAG: hydrogenase expression/formation protein HypE [Desulfitobacteriia bacterium]